MIVKELILHLQKINPELPVIVTNEHSEIYHLSISDVDVVETEYTDGEEYANYNVIDSGNPKYLAISTEF
jgi:hypothetical protein